MNELHLFAGAGGGVLGGLLLGHTPVCAVEIEPYCREVLLQRQRDGILPKFPIWDDICTFDGLPWKGKVDIVSGGFPCTDLSLAGRKWKDQVTGDITGSRSGLWGQMERVISEVEPRFVFVENVPALVKGGLALVLSDLASLGYNAVWCVLGADSSGYPHRRARVWLVAYPTCESVPGNSVEPIQRITALPQRQLGRRIADLRGGPDKGQLFYSGISDGVAHYMDRFKSVGNGQVPVVAARAFRILMDQVEKDCNNE